MGEIEDNGSRRWWYRHYAWITGCLGQHKNGMENNVGVKKEYVERSHI